MKKIIGVYVIALITYILGNNWYYVKTLSEVEEAQYQIKLVAFIPQWLPLLLFVIGLIMLIKYVKRKD